MTTSAGQASPWADRADATGDLGMKALSIVSKANGSDSGNRGGWGLGECAGGDRPPALSASSLSSNASPSLNNTSPTSPESSNPQIGGGPNGFRPSPIGKGVPHSIGNKDLSIAASPLIFDTSTSPVEDPIFGGNALAGAPINRQNISLMSDGAMPPPPPTLDVGLLVGRSEGGSGTNGGSTIPSESGQKNNANTSLDTGLTEASSVGSFSIAPRPFEGGSLATTDDARSVASSCSGGNAAQSLRGGNASFGGTDHEDGLRGLDALRDRAQTAPASADMDGAWAGSLGSIGPSGELLGGDSSVGGGSVGGSGRTSSRLLGTSVDGGNGGGGKLFGHRGRPPLATSKTNLADIQTQQPSQTQDYTKLRQVGSDGHADLRTADNSSNSRGTLPPPGMGSHFPVQQDSRGGRGRSASVGVMEYPHHTQPYGMDEFGMLGGDAYMHQPTGYHSRSYSNGNGQGHNHYQDGERFSADYGRSYHQHAQDGGRPRFATADGSFEGYGGQYPQHQYYEAPVPRNGRYEGNGHFHGITRSASVGTNGMLGAGVGRDPRDFSMRRSGSVPGQGMSSQGYQDDQSVHRGERFLNSYDRPQNDHRGYQHNYGGMAPTEDAAAYGDEYDVNGMRISRSDRRSPGGAHGAGLAGEPSRYVPQPHRARSVSYDPQASQPHVGERLEDTPGNRFSVHRDVHGRVIDGYHEPIVLPRYGIATMPRPPSNDPSGPGPKVVYNIKFKRTQRCFILGTRAPRELRIGTYVKVEADRGEDLGIVVSRVPSDRFNASCRSYRLPTAGHGEGPGSSPGPTCAAELKRIVRLASQDEVALVELKCEEEDELLKICRGKVRQRGLPMHVVDAEYQFDRHKLTFFFEAEGRIDFRELVRDLFSIYKTRIWMQQLDKNNSIEGTDLPAVDTTNLEIHAPGSTEVDGAESAVVSDTADSVGSNGVSP